MHRQRPHPVNSDAEPQNEEDFETETERQGKLVARKRWMSVQAVDSSDRIATEPSCLISVEDYTPLLKCQFELCKIEGYVKCQEAFLGFYYEKTINEPID